MHDQSKQRILVDAREHSDRDTAAQVAAAKLQIAAIEQSELSPWRPEIARNLYAGGVT